ncbi:MAG: HAD-IIIA family hydrolase, partial [Bacteroidaceae bacterium]|nr:HAD-IIIA family hydrolase [Bacteroidaceae bacterium]
MLSKYYPYEYEEDVFVINYSALYNKGIRGLIFDIDNTLVAHGKDSTKEVDELFKKLYDMVFSTLLLSNNSVARIEKFNTNIKTLYIADAQKPSTTGFHKALSMLGMKASEVVVIGDQVFTDIYGANCSGLPCILVKYVGYYK